MSEEKKECAIKIAEQCLKYQKLHEKFLLNHDPQKDVLLDRLLKRSKDKIRTLLNTYDAPS